MSNCCYKKIAVLQILAVYHINLMYSTIHTCILQHVQMSHTRTCPVYFALPLTGLHLLVSTTIHNNLRRRELGLFLQLQRLATYCHTANNCTWSTCTMATLQSWILHLLLHHSSSTRLNQVSDRRVALALADWAGGFLQQPLVQARLVELVSTMQAAQGGA